MTRPETARAESLDLLSAYLDDELDAEGRQRVEQLLAGDGALRDELARLRQSWDLLDRLPRSQVHVAFTQTTVEMVALAAADLQSPARGRAGRWLGPLLLAGCLAAALGAGFGLGHLAWPDPNEQLLRDLPLVEHLDAYQQAGRIDFVRGLEHQRLFTDAEAAHEP
ncbi:MAG TPA: zf-HC2 domain-containing protein [Pirellulales bacterium]